MLKTTKIRTKILSVILLLGVVAIIGLGHLSNQFLKTDDDYSKFIEQTAMGALQTTRASGGTMVAAVQVANAQEFSPSSEEFAKARKTHDQFIDTARQRMVQVIELVPETRSVSEEIISRLVKLKQIGNRVFDLAEQGNMAGATAARAQFRQAVDEITPLFVTNNDKMTKTLLDGSDTLTDETWGTIIFSIVSLIVGLIGTIVLSLYICHKGITEPLHQLRNRMQALAEGDTAVAIEGTDRKDEVGEMAATVEVFRGNALERIRLEQQAENERSLTQSERAERERQKAAEAARLQEAVSSLGEALGRLAAGDLAFRIEKPFVDHLDSLRRDFNNSVETLNRTLSTIGLSAEQILAGTNEIRASADDLSRRTEQQAASVEETAAALEQITTTVKDAARRADEARQLVTRTRSGAERSGQVVRSAVEAMHQIEKSSNEIGNIIGVIDDIAFQTNLLALNAGVEAARAGDAGKGFAVVAQEVRELAQRSANAAKEIKALITTSGQQVGAGVDLVGETGKALEEIVHEVQEINRHVDAIAEATREQSIGLQEINTAVNTIDQGTQQNAAMVEQQTAASHSLAGEANMLTDLLSRFKLTGTDGVSSRVYATGGASTSTRVSAPASAPARPTASQTVRPASETAKPAPSPARALTQKLASAFGAKSAAAAAAPATNPEGDWEEF